MGNEEGRGELGVWVGIVYNQLWLWSFNSRDHQMVIATAKKQYHCALLYYPLPTNTHTLYHNCPTHFQMMRQFLLEWIKIHIWWALDICNQPHITIHASIAWLIPPRGNRDLGEWRWGELENEREGIVVIGSKIWVKKNKDMWSKLLIIKSIGVKVRWYVHECDWGGMKAWIWDGE